MPGIDLERRRRRAGARWGLHNHRQQGQSSLCRHVHGEEPGVCHLSERWQLQGGQGLKYRIKIIFSFQLKNILFLALKKGCKRFEVYKGHLQKGHRCLT